MRALEERFTARGVRRGGILFFSAPDALEFIDAAREEQQPVFGVDAFRLTDTTTEPLLDHMLDLSVPELPADTWSEARQFVEQRSDCGFMFEIVV